MARPTKSGADYFYHDVDLSADDKIMFLEAEHGLNGYAVYMKILERVYRSGYFLAFGAREAKLYGKEWGIDEADVTAIVNTCVQENLFDKGVHEAYGMLTSAGIQRRFISIIERRNSVEIVSEYWLVSSEKNENMVFVNINPINANSNPINEDINPTSKVSKEVSKESKNTRRTRSRARDLYVFDREALPEKLRTTAFEKTWLYWIDYRNEKRHSTLKKTMEGQLEFLARQPDPVEVIRTSVRNGWQGLFEIKEQRNGQRIHNGTNGSAQAIPQQFRGPILELPVDQRPAALRKIGLKPDEFDIETLERN